MLTGDVLLHNTIWDQARRDAAATGRSRFDFRPILGGIRAVVSGSDVAICHLETPLATADGPYTGYPRFSVPPQITKALAWTGYDGCTTASNHTLDAGEPGIRRTLAALMTRAGLSPAGTGSGISVEEFLAAQRFVPLNNTGLAVLRARLLR